MRWARHVDERETDANKVSLKILKESPQEETGLYGRIIL
jgi:hypothetical protein